MNEAWTTVLTRGDREAEQARVNAYLYTHTTITEWVEGEHYVCFVLRTQAHDTRAYTDTLAAYQRGRLSSGSFGCREEDSHSAAVEHAMDVTNSRIVNQA